MSSQRIRMNVPFRRIAVAISVLVQRRRRPEYAALVGTLLSGDNSGSLVLAIQQVDIKMLPSVRD